MSRKLVVFLVCFVVFVLLDQGTKIWVQQNLAVGPGGDVIVVIPGFFDLVHAENPGAAFSILRDNPYRHYVFLGFTAIACWVVWDQYRRLAATDVWVPAALGLIASGAIGNAIDRVTKRTVTDFIRIYTEGGSAEAWLRENVGTAEWPSFNVADSALLVGVVIFVIATWKEEPGEAAADGEPADAPASP